MSPKAQAGLCFIFVVLGILLAFVGLVLLAW
jgi:hypothetical protein